MTKIKVTVTINDLTISIKDSDLISAEYGTDLDDVNGSLTFGVIEQNTNIVFCDRNLSVYKLLLNDEQKEGNIIINEYEDDELIEVYAYKLNDISIDDTSAIVTVSGIDATFLLNDIRVPKSVNISDQCVDDLLTILFNLLPGYSWSYLDRSVRDNCMFTWTPKCWWREGTLREFLDKVCILGLIKIYFKNNQFWITGGIVK